MWTWTTTTEPDKKRVKQDNNSKTTWNDELICSPFWTSWSPPTSLISLSLDHGHCQHLTTIQTRLHRSPCPTWAALHFRASTAAEAAAAKFERNSISRFNDAAAQCRAERNTLYKNWKEEKGAKNGAKNRNFRPVAKIYIKAQARDLWSDIKRCWEIFIFLFFGFWSDRATAKELRVARLAPELISSRVIWVGFVHARLAVKFVVSHHRPISIEWSPHRDHFYRFSIMRTRSFLLSNRDFIE